MSNDKINVINIKDCNNPKAEQTQILRSISSVKINKQNIPVSELEKNSIFIIQGDFDINGDGKIDDSEKGLSFIIDKSGQNRKIEIKIETSKVKDTNLFKMVTYGNISIRSEETPYANTILSKEIHPINIKDENDAKSTVGIVLDQSDNEHMGEVVGVILDKNANAIAIGYDENTGKIVISPPVEANIKKIITDKKQYNNFLKELNNSIKKNTNNLNVKRNNFKNIITIMQKYGINPDFINQSIGDFTQVRSGASMEDYVEGTSLNSTAWIAQRSGINYYNSNGNYEPPVGEVRLQDQMDGLLITVGTNKLNEDDKKNLDTKPHRHELNDVVLKNITDEAFYTKCQEIMPKTKPDVKSKAFYYFKKTTKNGIVYSEASDKYDPANGFKTFRTGTSYAAPTFAIERESKEKILLKFIKTNFLN